MRLAFGVENELKATLDGKGANLVPPTLYVSGCRNFNLIALCWGGGLKKNNARF